jgi:hypothetical protein
MRKVYILGHGKWVPLNGWINVPPEVCITFYSDLYTSLPNGTVQALLEGLSLGGIERKVWLEGTRVPNHTLSWNGSIAVSNYGAYAMKHPDVRLLGRLTSFLYVYKKDARTTLQEIFAQYAQDIQNDGGWDVHWACCRAVVAADALPNMPVRTNVRVKALETGTESFSKIPRRQVNVVTENITGTFRATPQHTPNTERVTRCHNILYSIEIQGGFT